jgi:hypothetical protein
MPLIINNTEIHNLTGPTNVNILIPKIKNKPILLLIGEVHADIVDGCNENDTDILEFVKQLNILAETNEVHFYAERFINDHIIQFIKDDNDCKTIEQEINRKCDETNDHFKGCAKMVTGSSMSSCYYKDYKTKCPLEFNNSCKYPNIKWQYSDPRQYNELFKSVDTIEMQVKKIISVMIIMLDKTIQFEKQCIIDLMKINELTDEVPTSMVQLMRVHLKILKMDFKNKTNIAKEEKDETLLENYKKYITDRDIVQNHKNATLNNLESLLANPEKRRETFYNILKSDFNRIDKVKPEYYRAFIYLLDKDIRYIDIVFNEKNIKKQLEKTGISDQEKEVLKTKMSEYLLVVDSLNYFLNDIPKYHGFIKEILFTLEQYSQEGTDENMKKQLLYELYNNRFRYLNDEELFNLNESNLSTEFFTKPLSSIADIYFFLRTLKQTSSPKLIVSLIGKYHIMAQTEYYKNQGDYDIYILEPIKRQCVSFMNGFNMNLNEEIMKIDRNARGYKHIKNKTKQKSKKYKNKKYKSKQKSKKQSKI